MGKRGLKALLVAIAWLVPATPAAAAVQILVEGESGSYVFDNARYLLTDQNGSVDPRQGPMGETRVFWRRPDGASVPEISTLDAHFAGPHNGRLQVGVYPNVIRYAPDADGHTMDVGGDGNGCNMLSGSFEVLDVEYADDGTLLRLALNLEQHCEHSLRALRVRIRINGGRAAFLRVVAAGRPGGLHSEREQCATADCAAGAASGVRVREACRDGTRFAGERRRR